MDVVKASLPQVKEVFFDDDTFTDSRARAEDIARGMGRLGLVWSCNAKVNVPYETLKVLKDNGLRLVVVGFASGNDQILTNIKKGVRVDRARQFAKDCHDLGIVMHGTFIVGLPGKRPTRSGKPSSLHGTSTPVPFRSRSRRHIRAPRCTGKHKRKAGSRPTTLPWSTSTVSRRPRSPTRDSTGRRSLTRSTPSTESSISAPARSLRSPQR
jgi:hypothetical protein